MGRVCGIFSFIVFALPPLGDEGVIVLMRFERCINALNVGTRQLCKIG